MKNKLGILTALILSLVIAGSAFAMPKASVSKRTVKKAVAAKTTIRKKHHRKRAMKKAVKKSTSTPKKSK